MPCYSSEFTPRYISWRFPNTSTTSTWKLLIQITTRYRFQRDEFVYRVPTRDRFRGVNQKSNIDFISDVLRVEIGKDKSGRIETFRRTTFLLISVISLAVSSTSRGENREFESISKGGGGGKFPPRLIRFRLFVRGVEEKRNRKRASPRLYFISSVKYASIGITGDRNFGTGV